MWHLPFLLPLFASAGWWTVRIIPLVLLPIFTYGTKGNKSTLSTSIAFLKSLGLLNKLVTASTILHALITLFKRGQDPLLQLTYRCSGIFCWYISVSNSPLFGGNSFCVLHDFQIIGLYHLPIYCFLSSLFLLKTFHISPISNQVMIIILVEYPKCMKTISDPMICMQLNYTICV